MLRGFLGFREINMKCVLTVAGLGTRLLPLTKEIPKEMLPIYEKTKKLIFLKFLIIYFN